MIKNKSNQSNTTVAKKRPRQPAASDEVSKGAPTKRVKTSPTSYKERTGPISTTTDSNQRVTAPPSAKKPKKPYTVEKLQGLVAKVIKTIEDVDVSIDIASKDVKNHQRKFEVL